MPKRDKPLHAEHADTPGMSAAAAEAEAEMEALAHDVVIGGAGTSLPSSSSASSRLQRLGEGVRALRVGGGSLNLGERTLMVLGGILAPVGLILVYAGWNGASRTPNVFEQIPYAISGGLLGLGLVFLGSFCYFAHWMTELVKEHRAQSAAVVDAINRLEETLRTTSAASAVTSTAGTATAALNGQALVATERGTMAHRPDCVVVAGKSDLRAVDVSDGLAPCKLCDPYVVATN